MNELFYVAPAACGETAKSSTVNKSNAQHAILFEAISLILAQDFSRDLLSTSVSSLGRFLSVKVGCRRRPRMCSRPWQFAPGIRRRRCTQRA